MDAARLLDRRTEGAADFHRAGPGARELAAGRDGRAPLLLLDEVAAHLERSGGAALFEEILALGAQAWMTGTDLSLFDGACKAGHMLSASNAGRFDPWT